MSASAWIDGGADTTIRWAVAQTSLGALLVAATDVGVCRVAFGEDEADLRARFPNARIEVGDTDLIRLVADVVAAVETGDDPDAIPLDVRGTAFQERVWAQLRAIPRGETRTYGEIAAALGQPGASRAVGSANGANPVAVLTPCHRVVRAGGNIGGYAYGPEIKRALLERERE